MSSIQNFTSGSQGTVDTSGPNTFASPNASSHLAAVRKRFEERKAAEEAKRAANAARNLTGKGLILDTTKPRVGGQTNIPSSNFQIIGGRAVPKGAVGRNITASTPSILTKDLGRISVDEAVRLGRLSEADANVFRGQNAATVRTADAINSERIAQQLLGRNRDEAQRIATQGSEDERVATPHFGSGQIGLGKKEAEFVNTTLQTQQIRSNAAKLRFANQLIQQQTDTNRSLEGRNATTELDDLAGLLENAPGQNDPISDILVTTDENGDPVSPRNIKLQLENALLTGSDPNILNLDVVGTGGVAPNPQSVADAVDAAFDDLIPGGLRDTTTTNVGEDGTITIDFSEELAGELRQQFGEIALQILGQFFDLKGQGIDDFFGEKGIQVKFPGGEANLGGIGEEATAEEGPLGFLAGLLGNPILLLVIVGIAAVVGGVFLLRK